MSQNIENNNLTNTYINNTDILEIKMFSSIITPESPMVTAVISKDSTIEPLKLTSKKKKCNHCNKKITLVDTMSCKCDNSFCFACRLPEVHNCTYDHKSDGKHLLEKANIKIVASKLDKI